MLLFDVGCYGGSCRDEHSKVIAKAKHWYSIWNRVNWRNKIT
ncbi:hypothetical protein BN2364_0988 [Alloalcanivorax xenomutans]|nr:hypothetical protein BN2364_0988 [Alloalcanivorax xenomutans]